MEDGAALRSPAGATRCKAPRHRWHSWHSWQRGICKLQEPKGLTEFESHPLRQIHLHRHGGVPYLDERNLRAKPYRAQALGAFKDTPRQRTEDESRRPAAAPCPPERRGLRPDRRGTAVAGGKASEFLAQTRASTDRPRLPGPVPGEAAPMLPDDRGRAQDDQSGAPVGPGPPEAEPEVPIGPNESPACVWCACTWPTAAGARGSRAPASDARPRGPSAGEGHR